MFKKIAIAGIVVILGAAVFAGLAFAQNEAAERQRGGRKGGKHGIVGQVSNIGNDQFSITTPKDESLTILVDDETTYKAKDGEEVSDSSFAALEVGGWVAIKGRPNEDGEVLAKGVALLPEDFEPVLKLGGSVESVSASSFSISGRDGESQTISVNADTEYKGDLSQLSDLEVDQNVGVAAVIQDNGSLLAKSVGSGREKRDGQRAGGTVVSASGSTLTILNRDDEEMSFVVTDETKFASRDGSLTSLADLEEGQLVGVAYAEQEDGSLEALSIGLGGRKGPRGPRNPEGPADSNTNITG